MTTEDHDDDDLMRNLSAAEREAMQQAEAEYDAEADNAAALHALGAGDLDYKPPSDDESETKSDDDDDPAPQDDADPAPPTQDEAGDDEPDDSKPDGDEAAGGQPDGEEQDGADDDKPSDEAPTVKAESPKPLQTYDYVLPEDYDEQVKAIRDESAALQRQFDDGEVDADSYYAKREELLDKRNELASLKTRADIAAEMQKQAQQSAWQSEIQGFFGDATKPELGAIDYQKDDAKRGDLDVFVRALANTAGNEDKSMRWFLEEAHKRVMALHGITVQAAEKEAKQAAVAKRKPKREAVTNTLAEVPGGSDADPSADEFAELDRLTGVEYERALAAMSPEKLEQYLATV